MPERGRLLPVSDTRLYVEERGEGYPLVLLHGGPGLDHHEFGDYLDPLVDRGFRLVFVDQRGQGRSDLAPEASLTVTKMAEDVVHLARAVGLRQGRYAVLGHSFGAFVALQNAVDFRGMAGATIVSSGVPSARYLDRIERNLRRFEPEPLRDQVAKSWDQERSVRTPGEVEDVVAAQLPFHFRDPYDPRIEEYLERTAGAVHVPSVLRHFADAGYGALEVEARLGDVSQPLLVLAGRHDRVCPVEAAEAIARRARDAELVVFEDSGHLPFVEENERYLDVVASFLQRRALAASATPG